MAKIKKIVAILLFFFCLAPLFSGKVIAENAQVAVADSYKVTAEVPSPVSEKKSVVKTNDTSTLADPINHPIVILIQLKDEAGQPLAGRSVLAKSDRGNLDIIEATSKISGYTAQAAEELILNRDESDDDGRVAFRITSFVPGEANISLIADNIVTLSPVNITFKPLPLPWYMTLRFQSPFSAKTYEIFSNKIEMERLSVVQRDSAMRNNIGTVITLSFWPVFLFLLIIVFVPVVTAVNFISLRRIRKAEQEQMEKIVAEIKNKS